MRLLSLDVIPRMTRKETYEVLASVTLKTVLKMYRTCTKLYEKAAMEPTMILYFLLKEKRDILKRPSTLCWDV